MPTKELKSASTGSTVSSRHYRAHDYSNQSLYKTRDVLSTGLGITVDFTERISKTVDSNLIGIEQRGTNGTSINGWPHTSEEAYRHI